MNKRCEVHGLTFERVWLPNGIIACGCRTCLESSPLATLDPRLLYQQMQEAKEERARRMPDETSALRALHDAFTRLKEMGWSEAIYCPKDGSEFEVVEIGSTGVHRCIYEGEWPSGRWWIVGDGDMSPSRPCLWRPASCTTPVPT